MKLIIVCGGSSYERDISLNSARSVYDNIRKRNNLDIQLIFIDKSQQKHRIGSDFLYSNTVSDFDFKLAQNGKPLKEEDFIAELKTADLVFPVLHGEYGEDGQIQQLLEELGVPFVASGSQSCQKMYNKERADYEILKQNGFYTIPKLYIEATDSNAGAKLRRFFEQYDLTEAIMKPIRGGSSIGVLYVDSVETAVKKIQQHLHEFGTLLIEPICKGREFTVIILQNPDGKPVALMPTEIEIQKDDDTIFNKRRKYLATTETHYYCPTRFRDTVNQKIRNFAQDLFRLTGARDFLRIDGWLLDTGQIYFSDFNPISGMEQNSFIFQQAARVGFSHQQLLEYVLNSATRRQFQTMPPTQNDQKAKQKVNVIMGGWTSERQVSLMSGTNVWLKLLNSQKYAPTPYLLLDTGTIYEIPYAVALNHTVEEMRYQLEHQTKFDILAIRQALGLTMDDAATTDVKPPMTVNEFIAQSDYVFIGFHGGFGEGGELQALLEAAKLPHSGSDAKTSALCMDKYSTGEAVMSLKIPKLRTCKKQLVSVGDLPKIKQTVVAKPNDDGCSTGVVILGNDKQLRKYTELLKQGGTAPAGTFLNQPEKVTISQRTDFLLEEFIKTDEIAIKNKKLEYKPETGWLELTVGVTERGGLYKSFLPSITVAEAGILSLEEKFQGGTGVNITPPPSEIVSAELTEQIMEFMAKVAAKVGVKDYCRIDIFANNKTNEVIVIEINTLPGLSPSTVLFQQAAAAGQTPLKFLESIIKI
jgi:D-alanine--D-alanine ligase